MILGKKYRQLCFKLQSTLLFNVTFHTKLICADVDDDELTLWVYMDRFPTEDEKDVYHSYSGEVVGTFLYLKRSMVHFLIEDFVDDEFKDKLLLFARCDYLDVDGNLLQKNA